MKIEKLETSNNKLKYIVVGVIITAGIFILINLLPSRASYRNTESIPLMSGTINYKVPDLNTIAMYKDGVETDTMPGSDYKIDTENSYCYTTDPNQHDDVTLATDSAGNLVIGKLKKGSKCYLYFVEAFKTEHSGTLGILEKTSKSNYTVKEQKTFSGTSHETTKDVGRVVYKLQDNDGDTYAFRGNPDNWVTFAGFTWRIIRINGDGTLRLLFYCRNTTCTTSVYATQEAYKRSPYNDNTYVGFYYGTEGASSYTQTHSNTTPSDIAIELKTWYQSNLEASYKTYLSETTGWCNDRTVNNAGTTYTGNGAGSTPNQYAAGARFYNGSTGKTSFTPKLTCNSNDLYTIPNSSNKGNQAMKLKTDSGNYAPVGLITADEAGIGGLLYYGGGNEKSSYVSAGTGYWTMSPFSTNAGWARMIIVNIASALDFDTTNTYGNGVHPVINVNLDKVKSITGKGTSDERFAIT